MNLLLQGPAAVCVVCLVGLALVRPAKQQLVFIVTPPDAFNGIWVFTCIVSCLWALAKQLNLLYSTRHVSCIHWDHSRRALAHG
jgi:hypothetical protein